MLIFHSNLIYSLYSWLVESGGILDGNPIALISPVAATTGNNSPMSHFQNFGSDLLHIPFGLLIIEATSEGQPVSSIYAEHCHCQSFQKSGSVGAPNIMENVNIMCSNVVPASGIVVGTPPTIKTITETDTNTEPPKTNMTGVNQAPTGLKSVEPQPSATGLASTEQDKQDDTISKIISGQQPDPAKLKEAQENAKNPKKGSAKDPKKKNSKAISAKGLET